MSPQNGIQVRAVVVIAFMGLLGATPLRRHAYHHHHQYALN